MAALCFFSDSSYSLLADDVLGSYLLCPHPKKTTYGSLIVRVPSGLVTHLIESTRKGKFLLEVTVELCSNIIDFVVKDQIGDTKNLKFNA